MASISTFSDHLLQRYLYLMRRRLFGLSGNTLGRIGFVETVLVWKYNRFTRNREDSIVAKSLLRKHGMRVVSITEPFEETPTGRLLKAIIESIDEFYSANLSQEIFRGMRESVSRGFYLPSRAPCGYRRVKVLDGAK